MVPEEDSSIQERQRAELPHQVRWGGVSPDCLFPSLPRRIPGAAFCPLVRPWVVSSL